MPHDLEPKQPRLFIHDVIPKDAPLYSLTILGFVVGDAVDDFHYAGSLPAGWSIRRHNVYREILYDQNDRQRGEIYHSKNGSQPVTAYLELYPRFMLRYAVMPVGDTMALQIRDYADYTTVIRTFTIRYAKANASISRTQLMVRAGQWAEANFPNWEDPTKHWN